MRGVLLVSITRGARKDNYYILPTTVINDDRLSWEARGMLVYLLSKPDHWKVRPKDLIARTKNCLGKRSGRDKVYSLLSELQKAGYVVRQFERTGGSFASVAYEVRDEPDLDAGAAYIASLENGTASPLTDLPETVESHTESPDTAPPFTAKPDAIDSSETAISLEKAVNTFAGGSPADDPVHDIVSLSDDQHTALAEAPKNYPKDPHKPICLTWLAYAMAFKVRYGQWPIYNGPVGALVAKVVARLGRDEAPTAARYYVEHVKTAALIDNHHPISSLLGSCESYAVKARAHHQRLARRPKLTQDKPLGTAPAPAVMPSRKPPITDIAKQARSQLGQMLGGKLKTQMTA